MSLQVRPFAAAEASEWDAFCGAAYQATFLHSRRFLSYHGDRFRDVSVIIEDAGRWVGLFPAAPDPADGSRVVSHPGITFGSVLHQGGLRGAQMVAALELIRDHYAAQGFARLLYKCVPTIYHRVPSQDDLYALFRMGAARVRCDLSCAIDTRNRLSVSERRRRSLKKAVAAGVEVVEGARFLPDLWAVLQENLARRHGVSPVHSLPEIALLADRFPENIRCICGFLGGAVVAGVVLFVNPGCSHAQYIGASEAGYAVCALDAVFAHCIDEAVRNGARWFDFGISNEQGGRVLNEGLYGFKSEFGGGGVVHEFFELDLRGKDACR